MKTRLLKKLRRQLDRELTIGWDDEYYIIWNEKNYCSVYYSAEYDFFVGYFEGLTTDLNTAKEYLKRAKLKALRFVFKRYKIKKLTREANK